MFRYKCMNAIAEVGLKGFTGQYAKVERLEEADAILVRSANMHDMEFPESLNAIARAGAGVNNIPLEKCAQQGIVVFNTPGANANAVKELVLAGMLLAARDVIGGANWVQSEAGNPEVAALAEKEKKKFAGSELLGKKLGIIGLGAIGARVANDAVRMGMDVFGYDPYISVAAAWSLSRNVHHVSDINEIFEQCDYISIHVPLLESTKNTINKAAIERMKPNAVVLNYARDLLVDEQEIVKAVEEGRIHRYVTDFPNTTVLGHKGVIVTPHLGASTEESEDNCAVMAVKELKNFLENGNIRNSVNYPNCDQGVCQFESRIAIYHKNVKKMLNQFTEILSHANIQNLANSSKGEYAYTLLDLDRSLCEETIEKLRSVEGVIKVRVIK